VGKEAARHHGNGRRGFVGQVRTDDGLRHRPRDPDDREATYTVSEDWASVAVSQPAELIRTQEWGPLTERRIRVASGLEIEFGFAPPGWAGTDPVDPGTAGVVSDGCTPILDHGELLRKLVEAVGWCASPRVVGF